ncbi:U32 family peptidase [bacterium]|nr:U32 family peptidase [bacterium]
MPEDEESIVEVVKEFREHIEEVYFPWLDMPSGRSPMTKREGFVDWKGQEKLERDLSILKDMGIKLDLLLNADCYGGESLSEHLANFVRSIIAYLKDNVGVDIVTTTSLMIAKVIKEEFPDIEIRASVNMRIGTIKAMEYISELFDSFYIQREYNRDIRRIEEMKEWADQNGKKLCFLVNSGCLNFCSGQTFHDNLVAHEAEIVTRKNVNIRDWDPSICWNYYKIRENWVKFLQNSWIRPEDLHNYDKYFSIAKLATRTHSNPRKVIEAYSKQRFKGNLMDLLEPGHSPLFFPYAIDNSRFPNDWFQKTSSCDKKCHKCNYCLSVLEKVLVSIEDLTV